MFIVDPSLTTSCVIAMLVILMKLISVTGLMGKYESFRSISQSTWKLVVLNFESSKFFTLISWNTNKLYHIMLYWLHLTMFKPCSWRGVLDTTLCDKVCQWLKIIAIGRWFSPGTLVSSTNITDCHEITEILLEVVLNTINLNQS